MRLNPFAKDKPDDLQRQFNEGRSNLLTESALKQGSEEQLLIEQHRERTELTKWQQSLGDEIKIMVHRLRNEVFDVDQDKWVPQIIDGQLAKQLCSDVCISRLVALLEPATSKNLMMSKYEKPFILMTLRHLADVIAIDVLLAGRKEYGIKMADMTPIIDIVMQAAIPTYFRALGANEKEYLKGIRKDSYIHTTQDDKKKEGFLNL